MKQIDMLNPLVVFLLNEFESEILALIDAQGQLTRSDLQGAVAAVVRKIITQGMALAESL